jgi:hypothetical protein
LDYIGLGNTEEVVIALKQPAVPCQGLVSKIILGEGVPLDHRPHTTIEYDVSLAEQFLYFG